jgi:hypothetical protein
MKYPLWCFTDGVNNVVIRGSRLDIAMRRACAVWPWPGVTIKPVMVLPIVSTIIYSEHHLPGWLTRIPKYEARTNYPPAQVSIDMALHMMAAKITPIQSPYMDLYRQVSLLDKPT